MKAIVATIVLFLLSYFAILPLLGSGWFPMHDDTQVGRIISMGRALRNGQFPVRWVSDLGYGYGYPLFNFYGPLPYYVGGALYAAGFSGLVATKIMFGIGIVGAGLTMFLFVRTLFGNLAGLVAGVTYLYAPYHAVQIYVRGAVGEFWVLVFLPLILLGVSKRNVILGAIGLAGVILSHTILGYVTALAFILGLRRKTLNIYALGLGLSAFFWLPAMLEMGYTNVAGQIGSTAFWGDHFICFGQLWHSDWGFGGSIPGCIDGISFKLGKAHILLAVLGIGIAFLRLRSSRNRGILIAVLALLISSIYMMLPASGWIWRIVPNATFVQYPWRMLVYTILALSVFAGAFIGVARERVLRIFLAAAVVVVVIAVNGKLFAPQFEFAKDASSLETPVELRLRVSAISDEYLPPAVPRPRDFSEIPNDTIKRVANGTIETEIDTETYTKAQITVAEGETITINRAHFPGWRYYIEGKEITPNVARGLPTFELEPGSYLFESRFTDTPVRILGNTVSLISLFFIIYLFSRYEKKAHT